jgi:uncharacterized membrane protein
MLIKKLPFKKKTFFVLAMTPVFLYEATSLAGDALVNTVSLICAGLAIIYSFDKSKITYQQMAIIAVFSILISMSKIIYFPIVLVFLIFPYSKFESPNQWKKFFIALIVGCLILNFGWLLIAQSTLARPTGKINSVIQAKYILTHPQSLALVYIKAVFYNGIDMLMMFFGDKMGYTGIPTAEIRISKFIILLYFLCVVLISISEKYDNYPQYRKLLIVFMFISLIIVCELFGLYGKNYIPVQGTSLAIAGGGTHLAGNLNIQGRYLIPSLLLFFLCFNFKKIKINEDILFRFCLPIIAFVNLFVFSAGIIMFNR